jgi:hypothetical protein
MKRRCAELLSVDSVDSGIDNHAAKRYSFP